ncbi:MAG: hypothetical protein ABIG95_03290 [Candidatus Woesearchaeota archaeon]
MECLCTSMLIEEWVDLLRNYKGTIVVEGIKDQQALRELGIDSLSLKGPLFELVENVATQGTKVLILTDLDKEGRKLYGKLKKDFVRHGVVIDSFFREWLFKNTKLRQIEGLVTYLGSH